MFLWNKILTSEWGLRDLRVKRSKAGARTAGSAQKWSQAEWNGVWRGLKGSRVWGDGERPQKETFTSAPPARITLKGELDSQKVTQTDVQTLTWSSQGAANHFYVLSLLLFSFFFFLLFCPWLEVLQKWDVLWDGRWLMCLNNISSIPCLCFSPSAFIVEYFGFCNEILL